jgi:hypothetical protein
MPVILPLKEMTLQEKLAAMESLWEDISRAPDAVESPDWHNQILDRRRKRVAEGKAKFSDWDTARARIRKNLP